MTSQTPEEQAYNRGYKQGKFDAEMDRLNITPDTLEIEGFKKDLQNSFNCLFIWWVNGMAFGLGFLVVMKISELWKM